MIEKNTNIWYVYIIGCSDKKLYVGIAIDVEKRVKLHNNGLACRFTKYRNPVKLLFKEKQDNYGLARRRERELKGFNRAKKFELIRKDPSVARATSGSNFCETKI